MACVKTTADGTLVVELFSGKKLCAAELAELDVNWQFFTSLVRHSKNTLAELPQLPTWSEIRARLPQTKRGGACQWQDIVILLLVAPFLTQNNINALCRRLERSPGLRAMLGLVNVPSKTRISIYKNQLLGARFFCLLRMHLLYRLKRQGQLSLKKLIIDGAPLWAHMNQVNRTARQNIPRELIRRTFREVNLTWIDMYYPIRTARQIPTSVIVSYYLLMYWLGIRSLGALLGWLKRFPEVLEDVGFPKRMVSKKVFGTFHDRFRRFLDSQYGDRALFQSLDELLRAGCGEVHHSLFFVTVLQIDHLRTNAYLFNLFRYQRRVGDPDAMYGYCDSRKTIILGYRLILLVEERTKLPLFGVVVPANQNEHPTAPSVLDGFLQSFSCLEPYAFPPQTTLFADLAYNRAQVHAWVSQHQIRLLLTDRHNLPPSTVYRRVKHRIRIEQTFSDLMEFLKLNHPRTITLPYVQTFVEVVLCARIAQAMVASIKDHKDLMSSPSYPAFGR